MVVLFWTQSVFFLSSGDQTYDVDRPTLISRIIINIPLRGQLPCVTPRNIKPIPILRTVQRPPLTFSNKVIRTTQETGRDILIFLVFHPKVEGVVVVACASEGGVASDGLWSNADCVVGHCVGVLGTFGGVTGQSQGYGAGVHCLRLVSE